MKTLDSIIEFLGQADYLTHGEVLAIREVLIGIAVEVARRWNDRQAMIDKLREEGFVLIAESTLRTHNAELVVQAAILRDEIAAVRGELLIREQHIAALETANEARKEQRDDARDKIHANRGRIHALEDALRETAGNLDPRTMRGRALLEQANALLATGESEP